MFRVIFLILAALVTGIKLECYEIYSELSNTSTPKDGILMEPKSIKFTMFNCTMSRIPPMFFVNYSNVIVLHIRDSGLMEITQCKHK